MAPEALAPGCELRCPGCAHRELSEEESLGRKGEWLARALGGLVSGAIEPVRSLGGSRLGYRGKTVLRASWRDGAWRFGLRRRLPVAERGGKARYEPVEIPACPVHSERVNGALRFLSERLPPPEGFPLAFVVVSGRQAVLVVKAPLAGISARDELDARLAGMEAHGLDGVWLNAHPAAGQRVFSHGNPSEAGRAWKLLRGEARSRLPADAVFGPGWVHGPTSFQQLLPGLHADALLEARRFLAPRAGDRVIDLCSGLGLSIRLWREAGAHALGVELGGEAVECARAILGEDAMLRGRAAERLPQLSAWLAEAPAARRLLFANPPRLGLESEVTRWLVERARPERIAYLSCSAGTLARDLRALRDGGYVVERVIPYDFFPRTHHVEALALVHVHAP